MRPPKEEETDTAHHLIIFVSFILGETKQLVKLVQFKNTPRFSRIVIYRQLRIGPNCRNIGNADHDHDDQDVTQLFLSICPN